MEGLKRYFITKAGIKEAILYFRNIFFELDYPTRTSKHIANPAKNSSAKRLNMFLRWMVRKDNKGVDFGIWKTIHPINCIVHLIFTVEGWQDNWVSWKENRMTGKQ